MRIPLGTAALAALVLALPATASAAYAPHLSVTVTPATPGAKASIASTITQAAGETASKTVAVSFPSGFTINSTARIDVCSPEQQAARACPEGTRIGSAAATASVLGLPVELAGNVYFGGVDPNAKFRLVVFLDNQSLGQHVTVVGLAGVNAKGTIDAVFDGLPDQLTTKFTLTFLGDDRALSNAPAVCGDYEFGAAFTSQKGETATGASTITIAGCPPAKFVVSPIDVNPDPATTKNGATVSFKLSEAATYTITAKRGGKQALKKTAAGRVGVNRLKRFGAGLKAGRYAIRVAAVTADGRTSVKSETLTLKKPTAKKKRSRKR